MSPAWAKPEPRPKRHGHGHWACRASCATLPVCQRRGKHSEQRTHRGDIKDPARKWCRAGFATDSQWLRNDFGMTARWHRTGGHTCFVWHNLAAHWLRDGSAMASHWLRNGPTLASHWLRTGCAIERNAIRARVATNWVSKLRNQTEVGLAKPGIRLAITAAIFDALVTGVAPPTH